MSEQRDNRRKPPEEFQFQPGESGNPRGRPRKPRRAHIPSQISKDVLKVAGAKIKKPGTDEEITIMEAYFQALSSHAIRGKAYAMKLFGEFLTGALHDNLRRHPHFELVDNMKEKMQSQGVEPNKYMEDFIDRIARESMKPS